MKFKFDLEKIKEPEQALVADPIRDATRVIKRNLLLSSVIALLAVIYGEEAINRK